MAALNSPPASKFSLLRSRVISGIRHPFGRHNIGNPYRNNDSNNSRSKTTSLFLSREESEQRRFQTERAISDLQNFFRENIPTKRDLQNSKAFSLWLSSNGLLPQFKKLWHEKIIFEKTYHTSSSRLLSNYSSDDSRNIFSRFAPRYFQLRSKYIQKTVESLANVDMLLPLLRQQLNAVNPSNNSISTKTPSSSFSLDPASLRSTLMSIATATDQMRPNPGASSPTLEKHQETASLGNDSKKAEVVMHQEAVKKVDEQESDKKNDADKTDNHKKDLQIQDLITPAPSANNTSGSLTHSINPKPSMGFEKQSFTFIVPPQPSLKEETKETLPTKKYWSRVSKKFSEFPFLRRTAAPNPLRQQVDAVRWIKYANTSLNNLPDAQLAQHDPNFPRYRAAYKQQEAFLKQRGLSRWRSPSMSSNPSISQQREISLPPETLPFAKEATTGSAISVNLQDRITNPTIIPTTEPLHMQAKRDAATLYRQAGEVPNELSSSVRQALVARNLSQLKQPFSSLQGQLPNITFAQIHQGEIEIARLQAKIQSQRPVTKLSTLITPTPPLSSGPQDPIRLTVTPTSITPSPVQDGSRIDNTNITKKTNVPTTITQPGFNATFNLNIPSRQIPESASFNITHQTKPSTIKFSFKSGIPASSRRSLRREEEGEDYSYLPERDNPSFTDNYSTPNDEQDTLNSTTTATEEDQSDPQKKNRGLLDTRSFISKYRLAIGVSGGAVMIFLLVFVLGLNGVDAGPSTDNGSGTNGGGSTYNQQNVVLQKTVDNTTGNSIKSGSKLTYTITVNVENDPVQEIDVTDPITFSIKGAPTQVTAPYSYEASSKTLSWKLTNPPQPGGSTTLSFTVSPTDNNTSIYNIAYANVIGSQSGTGSLVGSTIPSNTSNCNNRWNITSGYHDGVNFGDPACVLAKSALVQNYPGAQNYPTWENNPAWPKSPEQALVDLVNQDDPANADYWLGISACESQYDPNTVASNGPVGLFQMGHPGVTVTNGQYDNGYVQWQQQVANAVIYEKNLKTLGAAWKYWACARDVFGLW